jgi:hypothetical protein
MCAGAGGQLQAYVLAVLGHVFACLLVTRAGPTGSANPAASSFLSWCLLGAQFRLLLHSSTWRGFVSCCHFCGNSPQPTTDNAKVGI